MVKLDLVARLFESVYELLLDEECAFLRIQGSKALLDSGLTQRINKITRHVRQEKRERIDSSASNLNVAFRSYFELH